MTKEINRNEERCLPLLASKAYVSFQNYCYTEYDQDCGFVVKLGKTALDMHPDFLQAKQILKGKSRWIPAMNNVIGYLCVSKNTWRFDTTPEEQKVLNEFIQETQKYSDIMCQNFNVSDLKSMIVDKKVNGKLVNTIRDNDYLYAEIFQDDNWVICCNHFSKRTVGFKLDFEGQLTSYLINYCTLLLLYFSEDKFEDTLQFAPWVVSSEQWESWQSHRN